MGDEFDILDEMISIQKEKSIELNDMAMDILREFDGDEEWDDGFSLLTEGKSCEHKKIPLTILACIL